MLKALKDKIKQVVKLEAGMHQEAINKGMPFTMWLENHIVEKGLDPTPFYGVSQFDRATMKERAKLTNQPLGKAAFELICDAYDANPFSNKTLTIGKFYEAGLAVLFPEYLSNRITAGMIRTSLVGKLITERVLINGFAFKSLYLEDVEKQRQFREIAPGTLIPTFKIKVRQEDLSVRKFAIGVQFTYEQQQYVQMNYFGIQAMQLGDQLGVDQTDDAIYTFINGDGNLVDGVANGLLAANILNTAVTTAISKKDIIRFSAGATAPYQINVFVGRKTYMIEMWDMLSTMTNPQSQLAMIGVPLPTGYEWDRSVLTSDYLLGIDNQRTAVYVTNDAGVMSESDKIIQTQEVLTTYTTYGVVKMNTNKAIVALNCEWT